MSKLPGLTGNEVIKALQKVGFEVARVRGSHHILIYPDGRRTVVPVHLGETIGTGLLAQILRDCQLTRDELTALCAEIKPSFLLGAARSAAPNKKDVPHALAKCCRELL